ncbi:MAG: TldD/PmbA family protein [Candidatus Eisenbacteria bacterium]|uniref:TldD/PmbA family protein n=1 Tax=Eiseniibacteriota bacterium TaxID=2212470 RepID=A0A956N872_UNCEI|nr:TldD/PmbA family protein [Candidatus Eisenbacteria bacterium]MCB9466233.1 TldD/PmbA family protein [Candidatus Eisenbacteria bacterium]
MTSTRWSRRRFLQRTGQLAGAYVLGAGVDGLLPSAESSATAPLVGSGLRPNGPLALGLDDPELEAVLADLVRQLERKAVYASAFAEHRGGLDARTEQKERSLDFEAERRGVVFQAYDGERFREAATDRMDRDSLRTLVRDLERELSAHSSRSGGPDPGGPVRQRFVSPFQIDPDSVPPTGWLDVAEGILERVHASDARIVNASTAAQHRWRRTLFVNRTRSIHQTLHTIGVRAFAFGMENGKPGPAFVARRRIGGFEHTNFDDIAVRELAQIVDDVLRSERIPPGQYEVVTSPAITGLLAHESFGHGVEYDQFIKGRAKAAHFLGKSVAPEIVSIWDDPTQPDGNGTYYYDDEGWKATPTAIVEGGVFRRPITDLFSSFSGDAQRTANGRRQSFSNKAYARMSNTFFGRGTTPVSEIVGTLEDGIYLDGFQSGIEDPHGWGIQLTCNRGYEIKNGARTGRVYSPIGVTGYVPDILASITHVGDDFRLVPGTCGKGHKEFVPVSTGGPHLRFTAQLG